jgi:putative oxidoreductase
MINSLKNSYSRLTSFATALQSILLLAIRFYWGYSFLKAGLGKINNIDQTINGFTHMGIIFPTFSAYLVAYVEAIGGACFLVGFATRLAAIPLIVTMIVALMTAHFDAIEAAWHGSKNLFAEGAFHHLFMSLILFVFGPGKLSLDYVLERTLFNHGSNRSF